MEIRIQDFAGPTITKFGLGKGSEVEYGYRIDDATGIAEVVLGVSADDAAKAEDFAAYKEAIRYFSLLYNGKGAGIIERFTTADLTVTEDDVIASVEAAIAEAMAETSAGLANGTLTPNEDGNIEIRATNRK